MRRPAQLAPAFGRVGRWLSRTLLEPPLPLLAVEVRPRAVSAVRLAAERGRLRLAAAASAELPDGTLELSLTKPNVLDAEALRATLGSVLERTGGVSGGPVSLVLPDPTTRVALVPGEGVRGRGREAQEIVRFRLHKALPFDVRSARLAWEMVGEQVLVAVAPEEVVGGYEDALEALGYQPGLVEPASLALTSAVARAGGSADRLLVNWDEGYVSFVLLRGEQPLLVRTLPGEDSADIVARHAVGTLQFHRDRLGGEGLAEVVVRSAALPPELALAVLERAVGMPARPIAPWAALGIAEDGPSAQVVAGAAASAMRRAA